MNLAELRERQIILIGFDNEDEKECLDAVKQDGHMLRYVQNQTPEICLAAVNQNGYALEYVQNQTPEICLAAVKQDELALKYVRDLNMVIDYFNEENNDN